MSEITVIGLGSMGTALAKALQSGLGKVTVWNRTATKMLPSRWSRSIWCIKPGRGSSGQSHNLDLRRKLSRDAADHG